ncbi:MAG TPA: KpsF/GutQ family sugar-phosphate isomerase [Pyrinomonadaceae bacterium]|nr:KpsF/GutQ family sugar-phosphate isomerase [Pyrinomonadaceae bacterium]
MLNRRRPRGTGREKWEICWPMTTLNHFSQVVDLMLMEAEAIRATASRLKRKQVKRALELLYDCRGKVLVVGVGKSGNIAEKIAATLTSTGTAAVYLHPSDALHGGLGIVHSGDVVIALSNSGETDEVITMLPYLKHRQVPIIALVGNLRSTLARTAEVVLDASVDQEACPLNLAPTTSTTVALAIGDALAMTLMQVKGLTTADFAVNHPAGQLGKRLTLRVADLMHSGAENPTIGERAPWLEVVAAITRGGLGAVNVVDRAGRLLGIITDGDLRRALQKIKPAELESLQSGAIMTTDPVIARPEMLAYDALRLMEDRPSQISVLPVVDVERACVGLIRLHDIVRSGL